ncbi:hypothetical protein [Sporosarcina sp. ITBMC105]
MLKEMPKVGDKIRYLGGEDDYCHGMKVGGVYEVIKVDKDGDANFKTEGRLTWFVGDDDFHKYELVEETMPVKPQVGDKVRITKRSDKPAWYNDKVGEVFTVIDPNVYGEGFDKDDVYVNYKPSRHSLAFVNAGDYEIVSPVEQFTRLIANLARRVTELERSLAVEQQHRVEHAHEINELNRYIADLEARL